jgi:leucyl aminopeptidase
MLGLMNCLKLIFFKQELIVEIVNAKKNAGTEDRNSQIQVTLTHIDLNKQAAPDTVVIFCTQKKAKANAESELVFKNLPLDLTNDLKTLKAEKVFDGKCGETVFFRGMGEGNGHLLVVGLGDEGKIETETFRSIGATIFNSLSSHKCKSSMIHFDTAPAKANESNLKALTEGLILSGYNFTELKSKSDSQKKSKNDSHITVEVSINSAKKSKSFTQSFEEGKTLAECVNFSRRLGDMPGNLMTPTILANTISSAVAGTGIKCTVWDKKRIEKENMGGLLGVARGSSEEPRFIILEYKGAAASKKPIAFVGKGLTFDTGGISIKPSAKMEEMKYDMCGGANVLGTILAIAKLKLKVNAIAIVPSTENMPGSRATKPGDIHTARNGKTFEVNNTDAEGRLILSDALCYASELKPQAIIDAATLTGAIVVALGNIHTGYFTRNESLVKKIEKATQSSAELAWRMPLTDFHVKDMKGTFADLSNVSSASGAGSATAAAFLEQFVDADIPWAHFDIAGTAWATGNRVSYNPKKGASGVMIRSFVELAKQFA